MIGRLAIVLTIVAAALAGGYVVHQLQPPQLASATVIRHHSVNAPTIEQVRQLASLVTLEVPISDVQVSEIEGFTGSVKLVMSVRGDVQIVTDLSQAKFVDVDRAKQTAVLSLPTPHVSRPRLDHDKTRVLEMTRSGMWKFLPGEAGESVLTNRAMIEAQRVLGEAANRPELIAQASDHAQTILCQFFAALDWNITIQWNAPEKTAAVVE